jgi:hypothetical protein
MTSFEILQGLFALALFLSPAWLPLLLIWGFKYRFMSPTKIAYQQEVERTRNAFRRGEVDGGIIRDALRDEADERYYRDER